MAEINSSSAHAADPESGAFSSEEGPKQHHSGSGATTGSTAKAVRKLSTFSKMYDTKGDGELDEAELAMREMDTSRRGHLKNEVVYDMMVESMKVHKQLFRTRRIMFFLLFLVVVLAIANLGTSFAAASLAKETSANEDDELTSKATGGTLATQNTEETLPMRRATVGSDGRRRLCQTTDQNGVGVEDDREVVECKTESFLSLNREDCDRMVKKCGRGNSVGLIHDWGYGKESHFVVCPSMGTFDDYGPSRRRNVHGEEFYFERDGEDNCVLWGKAVGQEEGEICVADSDCTPGQGLACVHLDVDVEGCRNKCARRRWAPHKVAECQDNCDHPICKGAGAGAAVDPV